MTGCGPTRYCRLVARDNDVNPPATNTAAVNGLIAIRLAESMEDLIWMIFSDLPGMVIELLGSNRRRFGCRKGNQIGDGQFVPLPFE